MPEISGMKLAKQMRDNGRDSIIVFVTSAEEYVYEAYNVEAFHFLLKPVNEDKLKKAIVKITACNNQDFLIIFSEHQIKKILLKDILYIESVGRTVKIHCTGGIIETYKQIGDLEQTLDINGFNGFVWKHKNQSEYNYIETVWDNGDYILQISGNLSKDELLNLAKNAKF